MQTEAYEISELTGYEEALILSKKHSLFLFLDEISRQENRQKRIENYPLNGMVGAFIFKLIFIPCVAASSLHLLSNLLDEKTITAYLLVRGIFVLSCAGLYQ